MQNPNTPTHLKSHVLRPWRGTSAYNSFVWYVLTSGDRESNPAVPQKIGFCHIGQKNFPITPIKTLSGVTAPFLR